MKAVHTHNLYNNILYDVIIKYIVLTLKFKIRMGNDNGVWSCPATTEHYREKSFFIYIIIVIFVTTQKQVEKVPLAHCTAFLNFEPLCI